MKKLLSLLVVLMGMVVLLGCTRARDNREKGQGISSFSSDSYEVDDDMSSAKAISVGQTQNRNLHVSTDVDWIKISTVNGKYYIVSNDFGGSEGWIALCNELTNWRASKSGSTPTLTFSGDGKVWYVKVRSDSAPLSYTVTLKEVP
ncbi:MAG: hypothetical protein N2314_07915 [Brevinematales bacterium]|nr:hypothetical protein [Brevinematales bacterium]